MRADVLARKPDTSVPSAFSRTGDLATGDFGDAQLIAKLAQAPNDLSGL